MTIKAYYSDNLTTIFKGDCIEVMKDMEPNSIDTIITDPPYGLEFMGKEWDKLNRHVRPRANATYPKSRNVDGVKIGIDRGTNLQAQLWHQNWATEALRVAKPGAFLLAFGGTRTHHRLMCAIEDAGWEIRDTMMWLYGSGFPKSHDISKAIDKSVIAVCDDCHGTGKTRNPKAERWEDYWLDEPCPLCKGIGKVKGANRNREATGKTLPDIRANNYERSQGKDRLIEYTEIPATPEAQEWNGYGTALKPAWEPIIVAMKPLAGTFAQNALKWGVGGLNIDGGRIGYANGETPESVNKNSGISGGIFGTGKSTKVETKGRWPANVILSHHPECEQVGVKKVKSGMHGKAPGGFGKKYVEGGERQNPKLDVSGGYGTETVEAWNCHPECPVRLLDEQSGDLKSGKLLTHHKRAGKGLCDTNTFKIRERTGEECNFGGDSGGASRFFYVAKASRSERGKDNKHPTVKPLKLIEYLCRLTMIPTGGIVLDNFGGSGTTALACRNTGRKCILIEKDECETAVKRLTQEVFNFK